MAAGACVIYALRDPDTREYRYIGKANNLQSRIRYHKWETKSSPFQTHKVNWLRSLVCDPIVEILQEVDLATWQDAERWWIAEMRSQGVNLTNFATGGEGGCVGHSEETKAKLRMKAIERGCKPPSRKGELVTDETRKKLRQVALRNGNRPPPTGGWNKGKKMSAEFCEKNRAGHLGIPWSSARWVAQENRKIIMEVAL